MPTLVLVRHGTPAIDPGVPAADWCLSAEGREAVRAIAERLPACSPVAVHTSPERKARETASIISTRLGLPIAVHADLREHERGSTGFLPRKDLEDGVARLMRQQDELVFGDETAGAVFHRFSTVLAQARTEAPKADLLAVSHGTAISIFVSQTLGVDPLRFWRNLTTPAAVVISEGRAEVLVA